MVNIDNFKKLEKEYGIYGSWAIWTEPDVSPKSNTGDMSWVNDDLHEKVGTGFVFVGLNCADGHGNQNQDGKIKWKNFHSDYRFQNDYKLRFALKETPYWGSYITDIIKDYFETDSSKVALSIKKNPEFVQKNIKLFERELELIGHKNPVIVAMGGASYNILQRYLGDRYTVIKVKHYAYRISKDKYREQVLDTLKSVK